MKKKKISINNLFEIVGLKKRGWIETNENTYDFDARNPKNNWLYIALLGFLELKKEGFKPKSFATIGTGSGVDSIGASEIFHLKEIYQTDVHPNIQKIAQKNSERLAGKNVKIKTLIGNLCEPILKQNTKVDLVYANIPNIPSQAPVLQKRISASKFLSKNTKDCPEVFKKWLLALQYSFLIQAKEIVKPQGVIVDVIGARTPYPILKKLFTSNGYNMKEGTCIYKIQTEPEDILPGYSKQENKEGVKFDFYEHEKAWPFYIEKLEGKKLSTIQLKKALRPFRITATQALKNFKKGKSAGHICTFFVGTIKT